MAIHRIKYYGSAVLVRKTKEIKAITPEVRALVRDMIETMYHAHGVGLAAPQIGVSKRISVIDCGSQYMKEPLVLINPEIVRGEGEQQGEEGCLSLPELFLPLARADRVTARYRTMDWKWVEITGERLLARALLHEVDHLDGHLFIEHIADKQMVEKGIEESQRAVEEMAWEAAARRRAARGQ